MSDNVKLDNTLANRGGDAANGRASSAADPAAQSKFAEAFEQEQVSSQEATQMSSTTQSNPIVITGNNKTYQALEGKPGYIKEHFANTATVRLPLAKKLESTLSAADAKRVAGTAGIVRNNTKVAYLSARVAALKNPIDNARTQAAKFYYDNGFPDPGAPGPAFSPRTQYLQTLKDNQQLLDQAGASSEEKAISMQMTKEGYLSYIKAETLDAQTLRARVVAPALRQPAAPPAPSANAPKPVEVFTFNKTTGADAPAPAPAASAAATNSLPSDPPPSVANPAAITNTAGSGTNGLKAAVGAALGDAAEIAGGLGKLISVYGAWNVGTDVHSKLARAGTPEVTSALYGSLATVVAVAAGVVDDAAMATPYAPIVLESWKTDNAGPAQRAVGEALLETGMTSLRLDKALGLK
jgi:hypothetical protein